MEVVPVAKHGALPAPGRVSRCFDVRAEEPKVDPPASCRALLIHSAAPDKRSPSAPGGTPGAFVSQTTPNTSTPSMPQPIPASPVHPIQPPPPSLSISAPAASSSPASSHPLAAPPHSPAVPLSSESVSLFRSLLSHCASLGVYSSHPPAQEERAVVFKFQRTERGDQRGIRADSRAGAHGGYVAGRALAGAAVQHAAGGRDPLASDATGRVETVHGPSGEFSALLPEETQVRRQVALASLCSVSLSVYKSPIHHY